MTGPDAQKILLLTIAVPAFHADDLDECASYITDPPDGSARLDIVTEEWMRPDVVLTVCTIPGEKCMNDDFEMMPLRGHIVGAKTADR